MAKKSNTLWDKNWQLTEDKSSKLGQGGQGVVRQVQNKLTGEIGALKELIHFTSPERRKRMHIEAASLSVLSHPNICRLLDSDTISEGKLFLVTEYIDGVTLESVVEDSSLSLSDAISFCCGLLEALCHAHSIGVYHRDVKPENIMLRYGRFDQPVLIDFGISFNESENLFSAATFDGQQLGNRFLHLPELHRGARDPRSDLTQLCGVLLYSMTGIHPVSLVDSNGRFPHQIPEVRSKIANLKLPIFQERNLLKLFDKAFQVKLDFRWQTGYELLEALGILMKNENSNDRFNLADIRSALVDAPQRQDNALLDKTASSFMSHSLDAIGELCVEIGRDFANPKQGGNTKDYSQRLFSSKFGVVMQDMEVFEQLSGYISGSEIVVTINGSDLIRTPVDAPDWGSYKSNLKAVFIQLLGSLSVQN